MQDIILLPDIQLRCRKNGGLNVREASCGSPLDSYMIGAGGLCWGHTSRSLCLFLPSEISGEWS